MKIIIIVFLLIVSDITYGVDTIINKIYFNGLKHVALQTALFNLPIKIGDSINNDIIANSIQALFDTGYFEEISISNDDGMVVVTVQERPIINTIKFSGNKIISSKIIQQILDNKKINPGTSFNNCSIFEAKHELKAVCHDFGKFNATVKFTVINLPHNCVDLKIIFSEGKTAKIDRIDIFGNHIFSKKQLLKKCKLYIWNQWIDKIFNKKKYQKQKLFYDLEKLQTFYLNQGYAKFHIDDVQIHLTSNKKNINLILYVTEGLQYSFESLVICGNVLEYIPNIKEYLQIRSGELYNNYKIKEIEHNIRYILGKSGYIQPNLKIEYNFDEHNKTIKLYIYVDVGTQFYVREIRFEGNNFTKDSVIRREIQQSEQTILNYSNVLQDQERLKRFNYFKSIDTCIKYTSNTSNQVDVIYKIEECNAGNLNLSVGVGTESGINMQIGIYQENILGTGNTISSVITKNHYQTYFDLLILKKYFGVNRINISGKVFYNNLFADHTNLSNYNMKNYGININFLYPLFEYKTCNVGLDYISNHLSQIAPQIAIWRYLYSIGMQPKIIVNQKSLSSNINFFTNDFLLTVGWNFNNLDTIHFPVSGSRMNIISKLTFPGSNNQYYKIIIDGNHYVSLDTKDNWALMYSIYMGYMHGLYKQENPFYDNFYIGGINTIRGFRLNSIGPKAVYYHCNAFDKNYSTCSIENSQDSIGGNAVIFITNELITPIISSFMKQYSDSVRVSLFVDAGTVWDTYWKNTELTRAIGILDYSIFGHIRISSGVSLKWISPIGPVIFSYAKLMKKYSGDIVEPFQFSIGRTW